MAIALLLTGACDGSDDTAPRPEGSPSVSAAEGPCALLTQAEVESVAGGTLATAQPANAMGERKARICVYRTTGPHGDVVVYLNVDGRKLFDQRFPKSDASNERIDSLGDIAYLSGGTSLGVLQGDAYLAIGTQTPQPDSRETLLALARKALPRI
ncbi:MAG: DUF3558 domain-containing protein [Actinomycetota bacterium]|nr:DUF3558 domain-containing protein [Actinomycetota bacterium]